MENEETKVVEEDEIDVYDFIMYMANELYFNREHYDFATESDLYDFVDGCLVNCFGCGYCPDYDECEAHDGCREEEVSEE